MSESKVTPEISVVTDFDGVFESRVKEAIKLNEASGIKMYPNLIIEAGPYKPYCLQWTVVDESTMKLEFYSAARVFGFEHTVEDIADSIKLK